MRNRSKTSTRNMSGSWSRRYTNRTVCSNPATQYTTHMGGGTFSNLQVRTQESTMSDLVSPAASKQKKKDWRKRQALLRLQETGYKLRQFMPAHPCTHVTKSISFRTDALAFVYSNGACNGNRYYSETYDNSAVYAKSESSGSLDPGSYFLGLGYNGTSDAFRKHDWYALTAQFNEACDSFIPSSMLLGETMYEHSIFVNALKYIANPSSAIKDFLKGIVALGLKKKNLGTIARILKGSSNTFLSYNFGVKPAINDIVSTLTAHQVVQQRLWYLANNGGSYVPIRVRSDSPSGYVNTGTPSSLPLAGATSFRKWYTLKRSTAVISAWGKVRDDLNWRDTWNAYLSHFGVQKVIGLAWELIPFSFVLDWFTNAQERINHLTRFRTGDPFSEIRNLTCSVTEETRGEIVYLPGYNWTLGMTMVQPNNQFIVAEIREKNYSRYLTLPETSGVVDFSNLGLFQIIASGALIVQRVVR